MKRFVPYIIATALMLLSIGAALAVEKQKKEQPVPNPKIEQVKPTEPPKDTKPVDPRDKKQVQPTPPKKYDDFIDRNGNGIDDRKENLKKKNG